MQAAAKSSGDDARASAPGPATASKAAPQPQSETKAWGSEDAAELERRLLTWKARCYTQGGLTH